MHNKLQTTYLLMIVAEAELFLEPQLPLIFGLLDIFGLKTKGCLS